MKININLYLNYFFKKKILCNIILYEIFNINNILIYYYLPSYFDLSELLISFIYFYK